jgi:hypothetical protein
MTIAKGHSANLETLTRAFRDGSVCLMECTDKATQKKVVVLCAVQRIDNEYEMVPFAKMFDGNPYEELDPPITDEKVKDQAEQEELMSRYEHGQEVG